MTQPPLELLRQLQPEVETLLGFIRAAVIYHDDPKHVESVLEILTQNGLEKLDLLAICSPHEARREALIHKLMAENAALRAQAGAEQDTPESVNEAVRAANNTTGRPRPLPKEEDAARFDVIQLGRAYALTLKAAAELPEVRTAFRDAQARLAAALAQADPPDRPVGAA